MARSKNKVLDLSSALLQQGKTALGTQPETTSVTPLPVSELPMVLTLDELAPNPDNPRTSRNKDSPKPNCNVRNFTHSVNKKTYVPELPAELQRSMAEDDRRQITAQLCALSAEDARQVLDSLVQTMARGNLNNPTAWLLTVIKRARNGELFTAGKSSHPAKPEAIRSTPRPAPMSTSTQPVRPQAASREHVSGVVAKLRQEMARAKIRK